jgi:hypothetical protein
MGPAFPIVGDAEAKTHAGPPLPADLHESPTRADAAVLRRFRLRLPD